MNIRNLFDRLPAITTGEATEPWLRCKNVVIERIVSSDQLQNVHYDQSQDEWVMLAQGNATLEVRDRRVALKAGDALFIEAHTPHRLLETSHEPPCIWLAVHIY